MESTIESIVDTLRRYYISDVNVYKHEDIFVCDYTGRFHITHTVEEMIQYVYGLLHAYTLIVS